MHQLAVFLLASYGVTTIVTLSRLFRPIRVWLERKSKMAGHWIKCPMCMGVPVGVGWALVGLSPGTGLFWGLDAVAAGFVSSGFCWMMRVILHRLGEDQL